MSIIWQNTKLPANKPESILVLLQQSDKMVFVIKVWIKQKSVNEFLHAGKTKMNLQVSDTCCAFRGTK